MIKWKPIQDGILEGSLGISKFFIFTRMIEKKREVVSLYILNGGEKKKLFPESEEEKTVDGMKLIAELCSNE